MIRQHRQGAPKRTVSRGNASSQDGFILLESMISIGVVMVVTAALTALFTITNQATSHLRIRQVAIQLADSGIEHVRAFAPTSLTHGRGATSVTDQYNAGIATTAPPRLSATLATITVTSDHSAQSGSGSTTIVTPAVAPAVCPVTTITSAYLPTSPVCQAVGTRPFWVSYYLGTCNALTGGSTCGASLRAVIAVSWTNPCSTSSCSYVTSTLIDDSPDPRFDIIHTGQPQPKIDASDLLSNVGDSMPFAGPTLQSGSGVAPFTWAATGLPPGLAMASDGTITGTISDQASPSVLYPVTITVVDGSIQRATAHFIWTVWHPTIAAPVNQTSQIDTPVKLQVVSTCRKVPCTYTLTNGPSGLSIGNSGLITGSPTLAGTVTATVSVTDANGVTATSAPFSWAVLTAATVCVSQIALANGSFETPPVLSGAPNWMVGGSSPLLWDTTEPDNVIELWKNDGITQPNAGNSAQSANGGWAIGAENGSQWAELNANQTGALYQDLTTVSGQILQWSVWHRGRYSGNANGRDVMQVQIGTTSKQMAQVPTGQITPDISDDARAWVLYRGIYTVPAGQTTTRFQFAAITTAHGGDESYGNFIDNLSLNNYIACLPNLPGAQTSTIGKPITAIQLTATRGSGSFVWGGNATLPAGITMTTDGKVTGTPTATGTTPVVLTLTDTQTAFEQSVAFDWTVVDPPTISAPSNQTTSIGGVVSLPVVSTCLDGPCSYTLNNGPTGLIVSNAGLISGRVTGPAQTYSATTITITDRAGAAKTSTAFIWTVNAAPAITGIANQKTLRGASVSLDIGTVVGGTAPYTYSASGLPTWLNINAISGKITGTAPESTDSITSGITVTATDSTGAASTTPAFTWTVYAAPTVTAPANQTSLVGASVSLALTSTCPNSPCTYAFNSKAPTGITIDSAGKVTGTAPGPAKTYSGIVVTVTDADGAHSASGTFTWTVT